MSDVTKVTLECLEVLGGWHCRLVAVQQDMEGDYDEPYVLTAELRSLWMAGGGWQALAVLQEFTRALDAALRDGYE